MAKQGIITIATILFNLSGIVSGRAGETAPADMLVWCGLDYSKVKMIGTLDFRQPDQIFPNMLMEWNALFMKEMLPKLEAMAKPVQTDLDAVTDRNEKASPKQIERRDGSMDEMVKVSHITDADIADAVHAYKLKSGNGLGLVFIMDRLVKAQSTGCLYVVFFDVASRNVLLSERVCAEASGAGFRNYWFKPIKIAVAKVPKMYKTAKSKK
jgi:hypothetical protein